MKTRNIAVAAILGLDGAPVSVLDCRRVAFLERAGQGFREAGSLDFDFGGAAGLCGIRRGLADLMGLMAGMGYPGLPCAPGTERSAGTSVTEGKGRNEGNEGEEGTARTEGTEGTEAAEVTPGAAARTTVVLAAGFPGLTRAVLSGGGYPLFVSRSLAPEVLEDLASLPADTPAERPQPVPVAPYETEEGSGVYFLDMRAALNANPGLSSKRILIPFFSRGGFRELDFVFDHFPPWLTDELRRLGFRHEESPAGGGVLVKVFAP